MWVLHSTDIYCITISNILLYDNKNLLPFLLLLHKFKTPPLSIPPVFSPHYLFPLKSVLYRGGGGLSPPPPSLVQLLRRRLERAFPVQSQEPTEAHSCKSILAQWIRVSDWLFNIHIQFTHTHTHTHTRIYEELLAVEFYCEVIVAEHTVHKLWIFSLSNS